MTHGFLAPEGSCKDVEAVAAGHVISWVLGGARHRQWQAQADRGGSQQHSDSSSTASTHSYRADHAGRLNAAAWMLGPRDRQQQSLPASHDRQRGPERPRSDGQSFCCGWGILPSLLHPAHFPVKRDIGVGHSVQCRACDVGLRLVCTRVNNVFKLRPEQACVRSRARTLLRIVLEKFGAGPLVGPMLRQAERSMHRRCFKT